MNSNEIDKLIQQYLDGETSLADEAVLREYFSRIDLPAKYRVYASMFKGMETIMHEKMPDRHFDQKVMRRITKTSSSKPHRSLSFSWYLVSGVAATFILAILLFVPIRKYPVIKLFSSKIEDTFDDPQVAYAETINILLMVSSKLNSGAGQAKNLGKFEKGIEGAGKMRTINDAVRGVGELNKMEESVRPVKKLNKMNKGLDETNKFSLFNENLINNINL